MAVTNETSETTNGGGGSTPKKLHFLIVGGSLGGLATGIALKALGHDITILERNTAPLLHDQGAGIVAGGDALEFMDRYNRCQRQEVAVRSDRRQYLDKEGNIVHRVDAEQNMSSWDLTYFLMRANYDALASPYCDVPPLNPSHGKAVHLHDHTVTEVVQEGDGVRVSWKLTSDPSQTGIFHADRVIGADGPSSFVRSLFAPGLERKYAGYCALRGTVVEQEASPETRAMLANRFTFYHGPGIQILAYLIPGLHGTVEPGQRLINFVYYTNFPEGPALDEILTDFNGRRHRITVPPGQIDPKAWKRQQAIARERLPPQLAEVVCKASRPFVQAVTDVISPANEFLGGKVVLIGDALASFRPHTVASTSQAAFNAMVYADYVEGKVDKNEWKRRTMGYARFIQKRGVDMGQRSQHERLPLEEYIRDRDEASVPIKDEMFPEWATAI
ncbi:monooxygenase [Podospora didyma]|uniref:Monooxygenase n=1 Tax=Podospora didyma TaxID=330526 RepID=A0AAE0U3V0_9PEZI|nr:monooxygenase [Podospora didyma]